MPFDANLIWTIVSLVLTLFIFSYLFGDNILFRIASAILVGCTAGYLFVLIIYQVILPKLVVPLMQGSFIVLVPLFLSGLLLTKLSPKLSRLGNISMAYLVGAGAAIAVGGALLGTLFTQIKGAVNSFALNDGTGAGISVVIVLESAFFLIGTIATLVYFNFTARSKDSQPAKRSPIVNLFAWIGQLFIAITLGAIFAGVLTSTVTALIERIDFIISAISGFFG
jgi:hypothetical protein